MGGGREEVSGVCDALWVERPRARNGVCVSLSRFPPVPKKKRRGGRRGKETAGAASAFCERKEGRCRAGSAAAESRAARRLHREESARLGLLEEAGFVRRKRAAPTDRRTDGSPLLPSIL